MNVDAVVQEMRKLAEDLRSEAEKVRVEDSMNKTASYHVDVKALRELINGNF